jgi:hypothetical protein
MPTADSIALAVAIILVAANIFVSILVARSHYYSPLQKVIQCVIVWVVPLIGPTAIWAFLRAQEHGDLFDTRANLDHRQKMIGAEIDSAIHESSGAGGGDA